jgi:hypothetical protein
MALESFFVSHCLLSSFDTYTNNINKTDWFKNMRRGGGEDIQLYGGQKKKESCYQLLKKKKNFFFIPFLYK